jgi:hypothetical protein
MSQEEGKTTSSMSTFQTVFLFVTFFLYTLCIFSHHPPYYCNVCFFIMAGEGLCTVHVIFHLQLKRRLLCTSRMGPAFSKTLLFPIKDFKV